jgi:hypothetical protein
MAEFGEYRAQLVHEMLDELRDRYDDDQLSRIEHAFVTNIFSQIELGEPLSDEQYDKLCEIYEEYFG